MTEQPENWRSQNEADEVALADLFFAMRAQRDEALAVLGTNADREKHARGKLDDLRAQARVVAGRLMTDDVETPDTLKGQNYAALCNSPVGDHRAWRAVELAAMLLRELDAARCEARAAVRNEKAMFEGCDHATAAWFSGQCQHCGGVL